MSLIFFKPFIQHQHILKNNNYILQIVSHSVCAINFLKPTWPGKGRDKKVSNMTKRSWHVLIPWLDQKSVLFGIFFIFPQSFLSVILTCYPNSFSTFTLHHILQLTSFSKKTLKLAQICNSGTIHIKQTLQTFIKNIWNIIKQSWVCICQRYSNFF